MIPDPTQVYQPEADTMLMLKAARSEVKPGDKILEIGTGSGLIAAELARDYEVVATDINPHAAFCARKKGLEVVRGDMFSGLRGTFDLIIFNPPYLPTRPEERIDDWLEYALDGGPDGRRVIDRFAREVGSVLAPAGRILLLVSSLTGPDAVRAIFAAQGYSGLTLCEEPVEDEVLIVLKFCRADR